MTLDLRPIRRWLDAAIGLRAPARDHGEVFRAFACALRQACRGRPPRRGGPSGRPGAGA
jgi:hypothetical protein